MGNTVSLGSAPGAGVAPQSKTGQHLPEQQTQTAGTEQRPPEPSGESSLSSPMVLATIWLAFVTTLLALYTYRLWRATTRLATDAQEAGAAQAEKMRLSIVEANRAAVAMEGVAASMAINAEQVVKSVEIMEANAEVQRTFGMMNMRAYLDVLIGGALYQTDFIKFEARPLVKNTGNTPARNIKWRIAADILPVPLPGDFSFPLPEEAFGGNSLGSLQDGVMSAIVDRRIPPDQVAAIKLGFPDALYVWGMVNYEDTFGESRQTEFAQRLWWLQAGPMQEDGSVPEHVMGIHLERTSRTT